MSNPEPSSVLISSVKRILKPLVGFLMDNGLTLQWLVRVLKEVYVEVAQDEFAIDGKELTNSRISLITGVHRKDVASLLLDGGMDDSLPAATMLSSRLLSKWLGDHRFCDLDGEPLKLHRLLNDAGEPSFEELVASTSKDIRAKPVLDEWQNLGLVTIDDDMVTLKKTAFLPSEDREQKLYFLGKNVSDHLAAARVNTQSDQPPFLERSVYYDQLSEESLQQLKKLSREHGMKLLHTLNRAALELHQKDKNNKATDRSGRMNLGVYYYQENKRKAEGSED